MEYYQHSLSFVFYILNEKNGKMGVVPWFSGTKHGYTQGSNGINIKGNLWGEDVF